MSVIFRFPEASTAISPAGMRRYTQRKLQLANPIVEDEFKFLPQILNECEKMKEIYRGDFGVNSSKGGGFGVIFGYEMSLEQLNSAEVIIVNRIDTVLPSKPMNASSLFALHVVQGEKYVCLIYKL